MARVSLFSLASGIALMLTLFSGLSLSPKVSAQASTDMEVMTQKGTLVTGNLLGSWSAYSKGFTNVSTTGYDGKTATVPRMDNSGGGDSGMYQTISKPEPGTYILSGWSKSTNVTRNEGTEYYSYALMASVRYADGSNKNYHTSFTFGTHDWEFRETSFTLHKDVSSMTIYVFLREPAVGIAYFQDVKLVRSTGSETATFQDLPVKVLQTDPGQTTKTILKTKDGLTMGLGDSTVTELSIGGRNIKSNAFSGFLVRDVAETENNGIYAFGASAGSRPERFAGVQSTLGLSINAEYKANDNHIAVSGVIRDTRNSADGRAVQLSYALPVSASGWKWGYNIYDEEVVKTSHASNVYKELGEGDMAVVDWDSEPRTYFPTTALYNEDLGIAMAISMDFPQYWELEYNGSTNQYVITLHLGIVREAPDAARFAFVIYSLDQPSWGFRSAMDKYTRVFPEHYKVRQTDQGVWISNITVNHITNIQDYNIRFKSQDPDYRLDGIFEASAGINALYYIEPGDWWIANMESRTTEAVMARIAEYAKGNISERKTKQAIATAFCKTLDPFGVINWNPVNTPWSPNGAQVHINANPALPGQYNFYNLWIGDDVKSKLFDPKVSEGVIFDGVYLDELSGWWLGNANFNKEHYRYTTVPLTYSPYYKKPMLHRASTTWEFVKKVTTELHAINKIVFSNKNPDKNAFNTVLVDAMGTEQTALNGTTYTPQSIEQLSTWRTLAYKKSFSILLSNNYDVFNRNLMEKYFQRCLAFGIFASPSGSYSDNMNYFTSRNYYYERDRDLWKKYMPATKTVAEAGWEPVTLARQNNSKVLVERFGNHADTGVYFTIYNTDVAAQDVELTVDLSGFGVGAKTTYKELISNKSVTLDNGVYKVRVPAESTVVLAINNPKAPAPNTSKPDSKTTQPAASGNETKPTSGTTTPADDTDVADPTDQGTDPTGEEPIAKIIYNKVVQTIKKSSFPWTVALIIVDCLALSSALLLWLYLKKRRTPGTEIAASNSEQNVDK